METEICFNKNCLKDYLTYNEQMAAQAFGRQSHSFDDLYGTDTIIRYKRERVYEHLLGLLPPQSHILELNCGTGEDAIYLAGKGHRVHATDISAGMIEKASQKIEQRGVQNLVSLEECSYHALSNLKVKGPFNLIFSNFAGLNCTGDLQSVIKSFDALLAPGGIVTLVLLPSFCLWESMLMLKGKFGTATRRWLRKSAPAHVEGVSFRCYYYAPSAIRKAMGGAYRQIAIEGLCSFVPPSYMEGFAEKYPRSFKFLQRLENRWKHSAPWRYWGDYYIVSFQKSEGG